MQRHIRSPVYSLLGWDGFSHKFLLYANTPSSLSA